VEDQILFHYFKWLRATSENQFRLTTCDIKFDLPPKSTNILYNIYIHYVHAPSTKDNIKKGKPLFALWSFVWWHDIERQIVYNM